MNEKSVKPSINLDEASCARGIYGANNERVQTTGNVRRRKKKKKSGSRENGTNKLSLEPLILNPKSSVDADEVEMIIYDALIRLLAMSSQESVSSLSTPLPNWDCPGYRRRIRGLVNRKNSCYLLVCVQTLFSIPAFIAVLHHISKAVHDVFCEIGSLDKCWPASLTPSIPILRLLLLLLDEISSYSPSDANKIHDCLPKESGNVLMGSSINLTSEFTSILGFEEEYQQDASDCLSRLVTQCHEEMACLLRKYQIASKAPIIAPEFDPWVIKCEDDGAEEAGWTTIGTKGNKFVEAKETHTDNGEVSPLSHLFGGLLVSRSSYKKNSSVADKSSINLKERFFVLPLELQNSTVHRIEDSFIHLSKGETLSDFRDPEKGDCVVLSRRVFIDHLPPVLLLQLNRFYYAKSGNDNGASEFGIQKVLKKMPIHRELRIPGNVISKEHNYTRNQGIYQLHAIVFHLGYRATRGHYTTTVFVNESKPVNLPFCFYIDDERVFALPSGSQSEVLPVLLDSHLPFDVNTGRLGNLRPEAIGPNDLPPNIGEQPRTPYILVYIAKAAS